jgi:hypothetical protein
MIDTKPWYASRAVWGSTIAIAASLAGVFGLTIDPEDQVLIVDTALQAISAAGAILALYGRLAATSRVV